MSSYEKIDQCAHEGANGHNPQTCSTHAQNLVGNYKKGRVEVHGLKIAIENPRGSLRPWTDQNGKSGENLTKFHYGYFEGTKGADGDEIDCHIGPWPEHDRVWVINQYLNGKFDEHKIMLGMPDERTARAAYLSNYQPGWNGLGSIVPCSIEQLKWWISNGTHAVELTLDQLPHEGPKQMEKVIWDSAHEPVGSTLAQVLYKIREHDGTDGLIFERVTIAEILQDAEAIVTMDALVVPFTRLQHRMTILQKMMDRVASDVKIAAMQVSEPFMQRGSTHVAVIYELTDGQTISILFHNPDVTPKRIMPSDDLVSWKWMLNKKDITIAVAPERGRDLDVRTVVSRIMRLADKNSARFAAANSKRAERMQVIEGLKKEFEMKSAELFDLQREIEVVEMEREMGIPAAAPEVAAEPVQAEVIPTQEPVAEPIIEPLAEVVPTPEPVVELALEDNQDEYVDRPYGESQAEFWQRMQGKSPYQMKLSDFKNACIYEYQAGGERRTKLIANGLGTEESRLTYHRKSVSDALAQGLHVPAPVLADYLDLMPKGPVLVAEVLPEPQPEVPTEPVVEPASAAVPIDEPLPEAAPVPPEDVTVTSEVAAYSAEAPAKTQHVIDLTFLNDVIGQKVDMWDDDLADKLEALVAKYPGDEEMERAWRDAVRAYTDFMATAIGGSPPKPAAAEPVAESRKTLKGTEKQIAYATKMQPQIVKQWETASKNLTDALNNSEFGEIPADLASLVSDLSAYCRKVAADVSTSDEASFILDQDPKGFLFEMSRALFNSGYRERVASLLPKKEAWSFLHTLSSVMQG